MLSKNLKPIKKVKKYYDISFEEYAILLWHPVTSKLKNLRRDTTKLIKFVNKSPENL